MLNIIKQRRYYKCQVLSIEAVFLVCYHTEVVLQVLIVIKQWWYLQSWIDLDKSFNKPPFVEKN